MAGTLDTAAGRGPGVVLEHLPEPLVTTRTVRVETELVGYDAGTYVTVS